MVVSVLAGLVAAGVIGVILDVANLPGGSAVGAFAGGLVGGWLLYGPRRKASVAGLVVGMLSFPVELAIFMGLVASGLYVPPQGPELSEDVLMAALGLTVVLQIIGGAAGGLLGGVLHHPPPGVAETRVSSRPYLPPPPPSPEKYCIQCGAGLAKETLACPACGARQPVTPT